jgi:hypothetical protein
LPATVLQIYSAFAPPVLLALSMGLNLIAWAKARIDVPVVFSFDRRTHIHRHAFFELPAFFLLTLSLCFYASFSVWTWTRTFPPTIWPMLWLVSSLVLLTNPLPYFHYHARWWLVRSTFRVFASGLIQVEVSTVSYARKIHKSRLMAAALGSSATFSLEINSAPSTTLWNNLTVNFVRLARYARVLLTFTASPIQSPGLRIQTSL